MADKKTEKPAANGVAAMAAAVGAYLAAAKAVAASVPDNDALRALTSGLGKAVSDLNAAHQTIMALEYENAGPESAHWQEYLQENDPDGDKELSPIQIMEAGDMPSGDLIEETTSCMREGLTDLKAAVKTLSRAIPELARLKLKLEKIAKAV